SQIAEQGSFWAIWPVFSNLRDRNVGTRPVIIEGEPSLGREVGSMVPAKAVRVEAYCSTANLGAGFDVFALALNKYADRVQVRTTNTRTVRINARGPFGKELPRVPNKNSAGPPARALLDRSGLKMGIEIIIEKNIPPGQGLGSSGATAAACTQAMNHLLQLNLSNDELVKTASLGEAAASGSAHADNVGASLLGGFVIAYGKPLRTVSVKPPGKLSVVVVSPKTRVPKNKTGLARKLVPNKIETAYAVLNVGRASAIALGFARGDIELIGSGMEDAIAEPHRESLVPGYRAVKKTALAANASGVAISGAGPSVVALVDKTKHNPEKIGRLMVREFSKNRIESKFFVTIPAGGARIIRSE
ncbi:MAG TPA: homoserine kinase, partial [Candidatus Sulfotelmatobacter sp.]|nr:homoserine kinase [Candidatus Sulfotelmatobacter sp.]